MDIVKIIEDQSLKELLDGELRDLIENLVYRLLTKDMDTKIALTAIQPNDLWIGLLEYQPTMDIFNRIKEDYNLDVRSETSVRDYVHRIISE